MDQESAAVLIHKLYMSQLFTGRKGKQKFSAIRAATMRSIVGEKKYTRIKNELIRCGIIECDDIFVSGSKSLGYRIKDPFCGQMPRSVEILGKRLIGRIGQNAPKCHTAEHRLIYENLSKLGYSGIEPEVPSQWVLVDRILRNEHLFKVDPYGRMHTTITGLKRSYRNMLRLWDGTELSEIDISAAQPAFLLLLAQGKGLLTKSEEKNAIVEISRNSRFSIKKKILIPYPFSHFNDGSFSHFRGLLAAGNFYSEVATYCGFDFAPKTAKKRFFVDVLYGERETEYFKSFQCRFPSVAHLVSQIKKNDHRNLSHVLQRVESAFIARVLGRLSKENPGMFVSTIHDAFVVPKSESEWVSEVLRDELDAVGVTTQIRTSSL